MSTDTRHLLIIDKGEPYKNGERIQISTKKTLIGRPCNINRPGIPLTSLFISRQHALLTWDGAGFLIEDLQSKHGTQINGIELEPNQPFQLTDGDEINLAKGIVTMVYKADNEGNELTLTLKLANGFSQDRSGFSIDPHKKEVRVDGAVLNFSGKERELIMLLYRNRNKAVSYEEIKIGLWPERRMDEAGVPDVGNDEINALVYRLRKRLGEHGQKIVTVVRYGILLELN